MAIAADKLRKLHAELRDLWPFPWVYPPPDSERRNPSGYVVMPAVGAAAQVLQFQVPSGFQFELQQLMFCSVTTGMVPIGNPGDYLWTVNRNTPNTGTAPQGSPLADLQNVPFPFGNPVLRALMPLPRSENFGPTDIIRVYVTNVSGAAGAPNYAVAMLAGWQRKA
jgi:hypothetical protein